MIGRQDIIYKRVLITGANGLLGQSLVRQLSAQPNYDVLATGREESASFTSSSCGYIALDITSFDDVRRIFTDFAPDVVINCAAMTQVDDCEEKKRECWDVNVVAVEHLVKMCRLHGSRLVQLSTDFVFDGQNGPYRESDRPNPVNYYGKSKVASENAVRSLADGYWSIIRTVLVYGYGNNLRRKNFAIWVVENLLRSNPIKVVTDQFRSPTYVDDLARGIEKLLRYNKAGVFHLSGRELLSVHDFAVTIAKVFDLDSNLIQPVDGTVFQQVADRPPKTGFIILKAETELAYRPLTIEKALRDIAGRVDLGVKV